MISGELRSKAWAFGFPVFHRNKEVLETASEHLFIFRWQDFFHRFFFCETRTFIPGTTEVISGKKYIDTLDEPYRGFLIINGKLYPKKERSVKMKEGVFSVLTTSNHRVMGVWVVTGA